MKFQNLKVAFATFFYFVILQRLNRLPKRFIQNIKN